MCDFSLPHRYILGVRIDYKPSGQWEKICHKWAREFNFSNGSLCIYQGIQHGLIEVGLGLTQLFPHKKRVHYFKNLSPHFIKLMMALALEGYEIKELTLQDMASPQNWLDQVNSKDLFVLYSVDDPILGHLYPVEEWEDLTRDKDIFKICVSHNWHHYIDIPKKQDNNKINLYSMNFECCLAHLGEKAHLKALISDSLHWDKYQVPQFKCLQQNENLIVEFESASNGMAPLSNIPRIFDRAVLCWEDMDGLALIDQICRDLEAPLKPPGEDQKFETTSFSRWGNEKSMESLLKTLNLSPNQIRGLVIFSHDIIDDSFVQTVQSARETVLKRQMGQAIDG